MFVDRGVAAFDAESGQRDSNGHVVEAIGEIFRPQGFAGWLPGAFAAAHAAAAAGFVRASGRHVSCGGDDLQGGENFGPRCICRREQAGNAGLQFRHALPNVVQFAGEQIDQILVFHHGTFQAWLRMPTVAH